MARTMRILTILLTLTNAFWLGGLATLFLLTGSIRRQDPAAATRAAPHIFAAFETYHLILAGITLLLIVALWAATAPSRARLLTTLFLAIAMAAALISASFITPRLAQLRRDGHSETSAFTRGHYASLASYGIEGLAMLLATLALPIWLPHRRDPQAPGRSVAPAAVADPASVPV